MATDTSLVVLRKPTVDDEVDVNLDISGNMQKIDDWLLQNVINRTNEMFSDFVLTGLLPTATLDNLIDTVDSAFSVPVGVTGVTSTTDATDFQTGGASAKIAVLSTTATGIFAVRQLTPIDLSSTSDFYIWLKSDIGINTGDLQISLNNSSDFTSPLVTVDVPALQPSVWTKAKITLTNQINLGNVTHIAISKKAGFNFNFVLNIDEIKGVDLGSIISSGVSYVNGYRIAVLTDIQHTYTANKDTYVDFAVDGTFVFTEVPNGQIAPTQQSSSVRLARVVTDDNNIVQIEDLRVTSPVGVQQIGAGAVQTLNIKDSNVTTEKLADNTVTSPKMATGAVTAPKIGTDAVTTSKVKDKAVTTGKLDDASVTTVKVADSAISTAKLDDKSVTNPKIDDGAVDNRTIADGTISLGDGVDGAKAGKINGEYQTYTSNGIANTEDVVAHGLGRIPIGFIVINSDKACSIYKGDTAWTIDTIYLKCNVSSTSATIIII